MRPTSTLPSSGARAVNGVFRTRLVSIVLPLAAQAVLALETPAREVAFRYRFRGGDTWRERVFREVEIRDEEGDVVSSRRTERTDTVEVVAVDPQGRATVKRTAEVKGAAGPFEYVVSEDGRISLAKERGEGGKERGEGEGGEGGVLLSSLVNRLAPVLPPVPLSHGASADREMATVLPGAGPHRPDVRPAGAGPHRPDVRPAGAGPHRSDARPAGGGALFTTETMTLTSVERTAQGEEVRLSLKRRLGAAKSGAGPHRSDARPAGEGDFGRAVTFLDAFRAPKKDALVAVTRPARVRVEVTGAAGEGELVFDTTAGKLVSYRMLETLALEATLVVPPADGPIGETVHWTVTVRHEVERAD